MFGEMFVVGLTLGVLVGFILGIIAAAWLKKAPDVERLSETVTELQRRLDEWQRTTATQQQVEQVRSDLNSAQNALAQVDRSLQSLFSFTQNNFQPQVNQQFQQALGTLSKLQQALNNAQQALSEQSQSGEQRHHQLLENLQQAQKALTGLQMLLGEVSENLRAGQKQLSGELGKLREDVSVAKETVQCVAQQVSILASLQQTAERVEHSVSELTRILTGRRSGQVGEQIIGELLRAIPDDWLERNARLGDGEVEFAIRMPGGYLIPLDSKFVQPELVAQLESGVDSGERRKDLFKQASGEVERRAREIAEKYVNDERVLGFGIAAVPDSIYDLCRNAVKKAAQSHKIVVVPYSLLLPFVLSLYLMAQRLGISTRLGETEQIVVTAQTALKRAKEILENRESHLKSVSSGWSDVTKMVSRALDEMSKLTLGELSLPETQSSADTSLQSSEA
ncbi:MAG: DNA recombination protein RmuC [Armatimonadota bacterium]|nr:DNA recombination protein RmuC [Armatimonadota bacterium]MDW8025741.1 DNA recombination protein RmuC [Armatimonadota bacterium]